MKVSTSFTKVMIRLYATYKVLSFTSGYLLLKLFYGHDKMIEFFSDRLNHLGREYLSKSESKTYDELKAELSILSMVFLLQFKYLKKDAILIEDRFFSLIDRMIKWKAID